MNRAALALFFTASFLSYMGSEVSTWLLLVPIGVFATLVFVRLLQARSLLGAFSHLFDVEALLYIWLVSLLILAPSIASGSENSIGGAFVVVALLILARLYMSIGNLQEVLEAFFWSGILSLTIFIPLSIGLLVRSLETLDRFSAFSFHPNLLGFVLAGYLCAFAWKLVTGSWRMKLLSGAAICLSSMIVFFASSRGSLVAIAFGAVTAGFLFFKRSEVKRRKLFLRFGLAAFALVIGVVLAIGESDVGQEAYGFVDSVLNLSNQYRGLDSGLSGRTGNWTRAIHLLSDGTWFAGHGLRSSDVDFPPDQWIDNSYLVLLYEVGFVGAIVIPLRFVIVLRSFLQQYLTGAEDADLSLLCIGFLTVFLCNNVVARFLFSAGNPSSLLAILMFASPLQRVAVPLRNTHAPTTAAMNWS